MNTQWFTEEEFSAMMDIAADIYPILHGVSSEGVALILSDVVSRWVAGHNPSIRTEVVDCWVKIMKAMVKVQIEEMMVAGVAPPGWDAGEETKQ